jgi:hypothetical protein
VDYVIQRSRQFSGEEPPERVWLQIRSHLEKEGVIRDPSRRWFPAPVGWFRFARGFAYAAVFVVAGGIMYLYSLFSASPAPPVLAVTPQVPQIALVQPNAAEREQGLQELVQKVPAEHRATFVANWNQVSTSIQQLSNFVEEHPDDPFARTQLMNAFQQREHLWETLVRSGWEQF